MIGKSSILEKTEVRLVCKLTSEERQMKVFKMWAIRSFVVALALAVFSPAAFGDYANGAIVTMKLTNGGSPNFEIGPYPALINGATSHGSSAMSYWAHTLLVDRARSKVHTD